MIECQRSAPVEVPYNYYKVIVCAVTGVPKTIPSTMGILVSLLYREYASADSRPQLIFNLLVILVSVYNTLENPRRSEREVLNPLRGHSTRVYLVSSPSFLRCLYTL